VNYNYEQDYDCETVMKHTLFTNRCKYNTIYAGITSSVQFLLS